jgi:hypothetical protein
MKVNNKYLIGLLIFIIICGYLFFYFMKPVNENFTYDEEQVITAKLLSSQNTLIPQQNEVNSYAYKNANGINVNNMPLSAQRLTNPLCFNDALHSGPFVSSNKKQRSPQNKLMPNEFKKDESPIMKQLIKANDQLIDTNEELLKLSSKNHSHKNAKKNGKWGSKDKTHNKSSNVTGNIAPPSPPLSLTISVNTPGSQSIPVSINSGGIATTTSSPLTPVATTSTNTQRSIATPTYTSIYDEQAAKSPYTKCVTKGYSADYCNNLYGAQYGTA